MQFCVSLCCHSAGGVMTLGVFLQDRDKRTAGDPTVSKHIIVVPTRKTATGPHREGKRTEGAERWKSKRKQERKIEHIDTMDERIC